MSLDEHNKTESSAVSFLRPYNPQEHIKRVSQCLLYLCLSVCFPACLSDWVHLIPQHDDYNVVVDDDDDDDDDATSHVED